MFLWFNFSAHIRFFVNVLIEMNVNISNELNFSDVYRSVNYNGSLAKWGSFTLHPTQYNLHFDTPQKNEIHSLIKFEPCHEKTCFMPYANNKGADQPAHPRSLITAFVVHCLDSVIPLVSITKFQASTWLL